MLTIILNWIYIIITCFCMGFVFSVFAEKRLHYSVRRLDSVLMAGLVAATVYAQSFSIFIGVGLAANVGMLAACLVSGIVFRKRMGCFLRGVWKDCPLSARIGIPVLFLAWSYFTSRGYMVPDMNLYHGQSIRWIEEYGVVKGLGNLHERFGYNSSVFALSALYSMKFLLGRSLHTVNGLIAFLLSTEALGLARRNPFRGRGMRLSDYARVGAVYYLTTIWDEIIAPSSDYAVMCTIFFLVIKWLSLLEEEGEQRDNPAPYGLLCVLAVYALTLKVTAGLILLLTIKPACMLIRERCWKETGIFLCLGILVAAPWMIRTVLITGWLLYPFEALDLFSVDWKMPAELVRGDAYCIRAWGRGSNQLPDGDNFFVWFPNWLRTGLSAMEKLLVAADLASCAAAVGIGALSVRKHSREKMEISLVLLTMAACYLFWQFNAPMPRYGYAYILLLAGLTAGYLTERTGLAGICHVVLLGYGIYKLYVCGGYIAGTYMLENYVWQETYTEGGREQFTVGGETFYYSPTEQWAGYDPFPSSPLPPEACHFELRGDRLRDGFRYH